MSYKSFLDDIKKNSLKNVYLCYGKETYLEDWIISQIKTKYIDESFESLNFIHLDSKEVSTKEIINACETLPFMAEKKIVIVEGSLYFTGEKGTKAELEDELNNYIFNSSESTCLVFIVKSEKIDRRKKIVKNIKKIGSIIEFKKISDDELINWIAKIFKNYYKKISKKDIYYFVQSTGYLDKNSDKTLYDLENEINKLSNYVGSRKEVNKEDIDKVLTKPLENNIFKLVDGIGQKNPEVPLSIFNEMLLENEPVQKIMFMIIRQFRLLLMARLLDQKGYTQTDISKKMGVQSFVAKKTIDQSRNFTVSELEKGLERCLEVDRAIKTSTMDNRLAIEMLIISFSQV